MRAFLIFVLSSGCFGDELVQSVPFELCDADFGELTASAPAVNHLKQLLEKFEKKDYPPEGKGEQWREQTMAQLHDLHRSMAVAYNTPAGRKIIEEMAYRAVSKWVKAGALPGGDGRWQHSRTMVHDVDSFFNALDVETHQDFMNVAGNVINHLVIPIEMLAAGKRVPIFLEDLQQEPPELTALYIYARKNHPQHVNQRTAGVFQKYFGLGE
jgi:hypothetical protein